MTPAIGGVLVGQSSGDPAQIIVSGSALTPTTALSITRWYRDDYSVAARIELTEMDRIELIELLGGTP